MQTTVDGLTRKVAKFALTRRFMQIKRRQIGPDSICDGNAMFDESCMRTWNGLNLRRRQSDVIERISRNRSTKNENN